MMEAAVDNAPGTAIKEDDHIEGTSGQDEGPVKPDGPDGKPLSRKQQKKLEKAARIKEMKELKRAADRERRAAEQARKRDEAQAKLATMTEEERAAHEERRKAIREAAAADRARVKARTRAALQSPLRIAVDLDFDGMMAVSEVKSLVSQLNFAYGVATKGEQQAHLHLLGASGFVKQQMAQQLPHAAESWAVTMADATYTEYFKDSMGDVVYLTADSPNELDTVDTSKIYVIGGIVDRNRHKALCLKRAEAAGVAHARLPIQKHVTLATSAVITVNQVVELLVKGQGPATDWPAVLTSVLPARKRVDGTASDAGGGSKGDDGAGGSSGGGGGGGTVNGGAATSGDGEVVGAEALAAEEGGGPSHGQQQQQQNHAPENGAAGTDEEEPGAKRLKVM